MKQQGKFISLEGIEGAGKSTVIQRLAAALHERGISVITTREPGGTTIAEDIRRVLLTPQQEAILPMTELLLFFAARTQHIAHTIKPALAQGQWVLSDRFIDASYAYQGAGRGIPVATLETLETICLQGFKPDLTLLLDLPVEIVQARLAERVVLEHIELDRMDCESAAFFERTRQVYLARAASDPLRYALIPADQTRDQVFELCWATVQKLL